MTVAGLRRFLADPRDREPAQETCELCATPVPAQHPHLVQVAQRRMVCACGPCAFLFDNPGAGGGGHRRVPDRYLSDPGFRLTDAQWDALQVPVGMAFFLRNSVQDRVIACYPSPAGATESELSLQAWTSGVGGGRLATELAPDVEALLVRRGKDARTDCLLVPIDACYRLVGLVRLHWRGFDGGADAWREIDRFFDDLRAAARPV
ncbi:DUF5947 family protein [Pseudonocardia hydrocarbonoxydans]|uniref:Uncharacterized protein n=1 Tax=Pseudonocardia hydrocarbonoxydans TaxID=76726 RepID=A0A4Y3WIV8_9PSEU|nr:DUF5947 family protein [Pseudonocardia hydrocarbonoxydans]GEC18867.1 hypothetical protein PHY01_11500 [Pseudonocardia hydrocarbonoxydans]